MACPPTNDDARIEARFPTLSAFMLAVHERVYRQGDTLLPTWMFEPRRIVPPGGYHSPRVIAASLFTILGENGLKLQAGDFIAPTAITAQEIAYEVTNYDVPVYYVSESLTRAVAATELPSGIRIADLNWPMPAMVLGFPQRFMLEYLGLDVCYVYAAHLAAGPHRSKHIPFAPVIETPADKVAWFWFSWSMRGLESFVSSFWTKDDIDQTLAAYPYTDFTNAAPGVVAKNRDATDKVSALMLKLLCVLNWRENLIEPAHCIRPARIKGGVQRPALWAPNVIGRTYRPRREPATTAGTHASPRLHWRRGHAAFQVVGRREDLVPVALLPSIAKGEIDWSGVDESTRTRFWKSHRRVWIDPVLVGAPSAADSTPRAP